MARYILEGYSWQSPAQNAYFGIGILTCIVLLACVFLGKRARWESIERKGIWRREIYVFSAITVLLHVFITVVNVGLSEALSVKSIDGRYYILLIFSSMFSQISEFLILAVMAWTVRIMLFGDLLSHGSFAVIRLLAIVGLLIVGTLSIISWILYTAILGSFVNNSAFSYKLVNAQNGIEVSYMAAFTACSVSLSIMAGFAVAQERSKASMLMLFATLLLALRAVFILANIAVLAYSYSENYDAILNLTWVASFIYLFATMIVYVCVALVGLMSPNYSSTEGVVAPQWPHAYKRRFKAP